MSIYHYGLMCAIAGVILFIAADFIGYRTWGRAVASVGTGVGLVAFVDFATRWVAA